MQRCLLNQLSRLTAGGLPQDISSHNHFLHRQLDVSHNIITHHCVEDLDVDLMYLLGFACHCFALQGASAADMSAAADARWAVGNKKSTLGDQHHGVGSKGSVRKRLISIHLCCCEAGCVAVQSMVCSEVCACRCASSAWTPRTP